MTAANTLAAALLTLTVAGCGAPGAPAKPAVECDTFTFFASFMNSPRQSVVEISCKKGPPSKPQIAFYTVYTTKDTTVVYWANSKPISVSGNAPLCVINKYNETYPSLEFSMQDCTSERIWPKP